MYGDPYYFFRLGRIPQISCIFQDQSRDRLFHQYKDLVHVVVARCYHLIWCKESLHGFEASVVRGLQLASVVHYAFAKNPKVAEFIQRDLVWFDSADVCNSRPNIFVPSGEQEHYY